MGEPRRCTATSKRSGERCKRPPVVGGSVCSMHGGAAPQVRKAAERRNALGALVAEVDVERERRLKLGQALPVDETEAMIAMVHEAAANVDTYRSLVQRLDAEGSGDGALVGLLGGTKEREAARHIWVSLYDEERDRLMRYTKMCREAGVAARRVALAEAQHDVMAGLLRGAFDGLLALVVELVGERAGPELAGVVEASWREQESSIVAGVFERAKAQEVER